MSLLERCCECLETGRKDVCNPKALLNQGQFKNVTKEYFIPPLLSSHSFFSFSLHPQANTTNRSNLVDTVVSVAPVTPQIHNWEGDTAPSLSQGPAASISMETPAPLRLSSCRAPGWVVLLQPPAGCILYLSGIGAVDITTMYESFWISYALLGSEAVN